MPAVVVGQVPKLSLHIIQLQEQADMKYGHSLASQQGQLNSTSHTIYYDPGNGVNYQIATPASLPAIIPTSIPTETAATPPSGCGNWDGWDNCPAGSTDFSFSAASESRRWQTPPSGGPGYASSFGNYHDLVGYADIQYDSARATAVVVVNAASRTGETIWYSFNGADGTTSNTFHVTSNFMTTLPITVSSSSGYQLVLDPLSFIWQSGYVTGAQSNFTNGQKGAIVELFGWPWHDVAQECAFLGAAGYMGVKVWPPQEHVWGSNYYEADGQFRPWYFAYQPVSYRIASRSGTRAGFIAMIKACRAVGVRVYTDVVANHMTGQGVDVQNHRQSTCATTSGHNATAGSPYYTSGSTYQCSPQTGNRPTMEYPAVPYGPTNFHCEQEITDWTNMTQVTKGYLSGLVDLNTENVYVQDRLATYVVDLLSMGISGLRFDASKDIGPASLAWIFNRVKSRMGGNMPGDYISYLEITLGGEYDILACDGGSDSWYTNFNTILSGLGFTDAEISQIKIWSSDYPATMPACGEWILPASRFAIGNDCHDDQSPDSSDRLGAYGSVLIKAQNVDLHRWFEINLFQRTDEDWWIKLVLSSYMFASNGGSGFPDSYSDCSLYTGTQGSSGCLGVPYDQAYVSTACAYTMSPGKYTRVHRDIYIINAMRTWVGLAATTTAALGISGC